MLFELLLQSVLIPLVLGIALVGLSAATGKRPYLIAAAMGLAMVALFTMAEGMAPLPPVAAKHKIVYVLGALAVVGALGTRLNPRSATALAAVALLIGFAWLVQRQILALRFQPQWALSILVLPAVGWAIWQQSKRQDAPATWPVSLLAMVISFAVVALLGGFIGLGKSMVYFAAFLGGMVLVYFIDGLRGQSAKLPAPDPQFLWVLTTGLGLFLIYLGAYATNLSAIAFLFLLSFFFLPLMAPHLARVAPGPRWAHPLLLGIAGLLPAAPAMLFAYLNF